MSRHVADFSASPGPGERRRLTAPTAIGRRLRVARYDFTCQRAAAATAYSAAQEPEYLPNCCVEVKDKMRLADTCATKVSPRPFPPPPPTAILPPTSPRPGASVRMAEREQLLSDFVTWSAAHVTGDEKGQAQIFLDRLFRAFGQKGSLDVGLRRAQSSRGTAEMRIRKASEDGGGTSFADYVWKPVVLIEMKRRGADLSKHYRQAFDYWVRLVPGRIILGRRRRLCRTRKFCEASSESR